MHVAVVGACGVVGAALVRRLRESRAALGRPMEHLTLIDRALPPDPATEDRRHLEGDFGDPVLIDRMVERPVDVLFHLASVPGALAEREYDAGAHANLHGSLALVEHLAREARGRGLRTRVIFASSIAVYGALSRDVDETTSCEPNTSYGTHKLILEMALTDLCRRGEIDARSVRLPGIVARPPVASGHGSAFMSALFHRLVAGQTYECPVYPYSTAWWMSVECCLDNLVRAGAMDEDGLPASRVWQLPALRLRVDEVVAAIARRLGKDRKRLVAYRPDRSIDKLFGQFPELRTDGAFSRGFRHDGDADALVHRVLASESFSGAAEATIDREADQATPRAAPSFD